jgi:hypothetical protein
VYRARRDITRPPFDARELGEIDMVSRALIGQRRRRRVQLTPLRAVPVEYTGERSGEGPLTLGQLNMYMWLSRMSDHAHAILRVELPVPAVVSVDEVADRRVLAPGGGPRRDRDPQA